MTNGRVAMLLWGVALGAGVAGGGVAGAQSLAARGLELAQAKEPASRDALFGAEEPSADEDKPESRDSLFGDDSTTQKASAARVSGFVDVLGGYTYASPEHASRGVVRLQLTAQGTLDAGVKWKLSGRADADPVYWSSNFYPSPVKDDQRVDFFFRESYLDFSAADWDFRVGAQQIVWGEVVGLFFADVVSARDMREFLLPTFDIMRIPQWAFRAERFFGDAHLELVWIPVAGFDKIGKPGADFYPVRLPSPLPEGTEALFRTPQRPDRTLGNGNFGVRANTLYSGWDVAVFYYRSFNTQPTFYRVASDSPTLPFVFEPRYDRIWRTGGTLSKDMGPAVLRAEAVYTHGQGLTIDDPSIADGVVKRNTVDAIASVEFNVAVDTRVNVQAFHRMVLGDGLEPAIGAEGPGASVLIAHKWSERFEPQILWIRSFGDDGGLIRPRLNWTPVKNISVGIGADIFTGPAESFFGRYNNRDRFYTEVRYDF